MWNTRILCVSLEGFTSIGRRVDLKFRPLNVLVGANGTGKSNFLLFFRMLNYMMSGSLQAFIGKFGGANSLLYFGNQTESCSGTVEFETQDGINRYTFRLSRARPDRLIFTDEALDFQGHGRQSHREPMGVGAGHVETALIRPENRPKKIFRVFSECLRQFRFFQFHDTSDSSPLRSRCRVGDGRSLRSNGGNLAAVLFNLYSHFPNEYARVVQTVQSVAPFVAEFIFEPDAVSSELSSREGTDNDSPVADPWLLLRWRGKSPDYVFGVHQLSDGTLRFLALVTLLMLPPPMRPAAIFVDEPELGLHPFALELLASLLKEVSQQTQLVISTQSPTLLSFFEPEDLVVVEQTEGSTNLHRLTSEPLAEWLKDYTLGELIQKNVIEAGPRYA